MYRIVKQMTGLVALLIMLQGVVSPCSAQAGKLSFSVKPDSARVRISDRYAHPSWLKQLFLGKNYRKEWSTAVMLPILDLRVLQLHPVEMGGGKQTKSLRLVDKDSTEWVLRMIDKDVGPALPPVIRNPITVSIVQDMVSAAHPYAPLTIPPLARATGVKAASPRIYFIPDDPLLGKYGDVFANTVCLLERKEILAKNEETKSTKKVISHLLSSHRYAVGQEAYLRARLLDMLIADWDRHYDQWRWEEKEGDEITYYLPLPRDRDQAFFYSRGLFVKLVRYLALKSLVGFACTTSRLTDLNAVAWSMDRMFLNQLNASDWDRIAKKFQNDLPDDTIKEAVKKLPPEIYAINGTTITRKLIRRKNTLARDVLQYYRFLSRSVLIYGTDQAERFRLSGNKDSIMLVVYDATDPHKKLYQRCFYPEVTKKIRLLGLGGDDVFEGVITGKTKIKIEVDSGKGTNQYAVKSPKKLKVRHSDLDADGYEKLVHKQLRIIE